MKPSIGTFTPFDFIISCDGKTVEVIGTSKIADDIREMIADPDSHYSNMKKEKGDSFDPVDEITRSSMNFTPHIEDYSPEKLAEEKKLIKNAK